METLGKITLVIVALFISFLVGLLGVYVVISIANLFGLAFIAQFSFLQIYGIWTIIGLFKYKYKESDPDKPFYKMLKQYFVIIFVNAGIILGTWGISFIAYHILS